MRALGERHTDTLASMASLAETLIIRGNTSQAEELYASVLAAYAEKVVDPEVPIVLDQYASLLLTVELPSLRDPEKALRAATRAVEMTNGQNFNMLDTLARAYQMTGDLRQAVEAQRKALSLLPADGSPMRAEVESTLGAYLIEQKSLSEAEGLLLGSFQWLQEHWEGDADRLKAFIERIVKLYEFWDAAEPGKGYAEKAAEWRAQLVPVGPPAP